MPEAFRASFIFFSDQIRPVKSCKRFVTVKTSSQRSNLFCRVSLRLPNMAERTIRCRVRILNFFLYFLANCVNWGDGCQFFRLLCSLKGRRQFDKHLSHLAHTAGCKLNRLHGSQMRGNRFFFYCHRLFESRLHFCHILPPAGFCNQIRSCHQKPGLLQK